MHASALTKCYGRRSVLDDVTFHVDRICPGIRLSTAQTLISDVALANDVVHVLEVHGVIGRRPPAALRLAVSVVRKVKRPRPWADAVTVMFSRLRPIPAAA